MPPTGIELAVILANAQLFEQGFQYPVIFASQQREDELELDQWYTSATRYHCAIEAFRYQNDEDGRRFHAGIEANFEVNNISAFYFMALANRLEPSLESLSEYLSRVEMYENRR
jgi:hypothetical protein